MQEEVLLQGCRNNDPAAQQELYQRHSTKMLAVCYRYAKTREDAEDMLQEAFIKIFSQITQFESRGSLEGWMLRTVVHTCINHLKKNKKFNDNVDLAFAGNITMKEDTIQGMMQAKQIVESIRSLPMGYRTVLNLYAIEGYSHREIGAMLDIEESTSRSQYTRAKQMLEAMLTQKSILQPKEQQKKKWMLLMKSV